MKKKIVLVNQTANYLFADIIHAFAKKHGDHHIEAWYGSFDHDKSTLPANVKLAEGPQYSRDSFKERFRSWVAFYLWLRKKIKKQDAANTHFFFVSNPPLFVFLPRLAKLDFTCLIYDLYPDVLEGISKHGFLKRLTKRWQARNRKVFPKAAHIYTIGEGLQKAIQQYSPANVSLVPVWNKQADANASNRDFKTEWGLTGKKIILYSGNIGITHPLEYLVALAKELQRDPQWQIVIVGKGNKKQQLQELALNMPNVMFYDPVPLTDLQQLLSVATWGYVTLDTGATNGSVPSKTFNLLAQGIPILALVNGSSEIARLLNQYDSGICFTENDIAATAQKLVGFSAEAHHKLSENAVICAKDFTPALAARFAEHWPN